MPIAQELIFNGDHPEFQFRDIFIMPLLSRLGFSIVVNYHGQREFGRDVIFGEIDRFGHVVYHAMQIKYEPSIALTDSHALVQDAEQATHNHFAHPGTGAKEYTSTFYVVNAGSFSDQARENFFSTTARRGIRDAKLIDGTALVLLDKTATLNRNAYLRERLTGILQEVRRNRNVIADLKPRIAAYVDKEIQGGYPMLRCRNTATENYLNAPFPLPNLTVNAVDQYWESIRVLNAVADSIGAPVTYGDFKKRRAESFAECAAQSLELAQNVEHAVQLLAELGPG
jgi:hypothetical protein